MIDVAISALPNQSLTIQIDSRLYVISIREANGVMSVSITRDGEVVVSNMRATAGTPLLPYQYQEKGNFIIITEGGALPYYEQFGITQFMLYVTPAELAAYRES